ncbi:S9 family peptidase [Streptacidiphilus jiangxiensis]|uniref:Dipeptidyl aminopeptidase/acylaminoacyl peptidase n=1 Tax=Streptacidiphilus jiangxiensis TaxID=235985 RepID=A0A1H7MRT0_STRJI|nr:S9 family peptidase [Streptacidiphilus jiangxiensis]SEL14010.1 Dipeptidyl aminopeptidase/acylaminoacyl peptidase [Streptacidiphilus jiangxiensis]
MPSPAPQPSPGSTEPTEPLTAELVVDRAAAVAPAISPDGRLVAYGVIANGGSEGRPHGSIWVAAADGSTAPRRLTDGTARDLGPRWAPDSASVFFTSDREERGTAQLQRLRVDNGQDVAKAEALTRWHGGIVDHRPLVDGRTVALLAEDEPTAEDERREAERDDARIWGRHLPVTRLRLLDLETGTVRTVDGLGDRHVVEVAPRPDGGPLAVLTWSTPELDPGARTVELHLVDPDSAAVHELGPVGTDAESPAWWNRDGVWHLAHLAVTPGHAVGGFAVLDTVPPATGPAPEHRNLTAGMPVCPIELAQVADGPPLALFADGLDTALYRLDPDSLRFHQVSSAPGTLAGLSVSRSGATLALLASTAYEPRNVHAGPACGPLVRLSDAAPELRGVRWGVQERLSYRAADGLELDGLLIRPVGGTAQDPPDGPFPLVTLVHGGPYFRHADEFVLNAVDCGQWLAHAGYAVFLANPRGGSGRGHAFAAEVAGEIGGDEWTDILTGIDLLVDRGVADPERLGISGWSHGGFMAAWAVGHSDRFKAAVMGAGISDWGMQAGIGDWGALESGLSGSTGWDGPGPHRHDRNSPISYASRMRTPVLILHGEEDTNVPLGQAILFHRALRHFGVEHELVVYPREGHGLRERAHQLDALRRVRAWFDRRLQASVRL